MNVTQLIKRVRRSAFIEDTAVDWTDANIVEEMNDVLTQLYERAVVNAHQGHWLQMQYIPLTVGRRSYRLPERACAGGIERVQYTANSPADWYALPQVAEADALRYEYASATSGPQRCAVRGEALWMMPPVESNGFVARVQYMIRPSRLVLPQAANAGVITAINTTTRAITVSVAVQSVSEAGSLTAPAGTSVIDIVHPEGWHCVQWTGTATGVATTTITLSADPSGLPEADDLSDIVVGDVVRVANQTDWPALPFDFHRTLADATAAKILTARGMAQKAAELSQAHVVPDLQRFGDMLTPRVAADAPIFVAPEFS